jgi:ATP-dependent Clp protease adapter protein ClpS
MHMNFKTIELSKRRFIVSIYEIRQEIVFAEEFSGQYVKTVTLSDGTTRTVELTPTMLGGSTAMQFNDNATPMEFVVTVLGTHLGLSREDSVHTMFAIHRRGGALIPTPSLAEAERIAALITAEAAKNSHPLVCRPVSISS